MAKVKKGYKSIAISCKAKNLLEEIATAFEEEHSVYGTVFNRGVYVSALIEEAYNKMKEEKEV